MSELIKVIIPAFTKCKCQGFSIGCRHVPIGPDGTCEVSPEELDVLGGRFVGITVVEGAPPVETTPPAPPADTGKSKTANKAKKAEG